MKLNIPEGGHDVVLHGELREMIETWSSLIVDIDARVCEVYGLARGLSVAEVVPTLAYAHIAKAAFGMCSAASIGESEFDPVEFGLRCADIAREQIARYALRNESDES